MKKLLLSTAIIFIGFSISFGQPSDFVNPINFKPTDYNKQQVVSYIERNVEEDYSSIGMGDPSTLRMMEKKNLDAFKELTKATNTSLLRSVIKTYCDINMCNYDTINMMYKKQREASSQSLDW